MVWGKEKCNAKYNIVSLQTLETEEVGANSRTFREFVFLTTSEISCLLTHVRGTKFVVRKIGRKITISCHQQWRVSSTQPWLMVKKGSYICITSFYTKQE